VLELGLIGRTHRAPEEPDRPPYAFDRFRPQGADAVVLERSREIRPGGVSDEVFDDDPAIDFDRP
jgi:hypothetical protein